MPTPTQHITKHLATLTLLLTLTTATHPNPVGNCKNSCAHCDFDGSSTWCSSCYRSTHILPTSTSGYCSGMGSPIVNCLITQSVAGINICRLCEPPYGPLLEKAHPDPFAQMSHKCLEIQAQHATKGYFIFDSSNPGKPKFSAVECSKGFKPVQVSPDSGVKQCKPLDSDDKTESVNKCGKWVYSVKKKLDECVECEGNRVFYERQLVGEKRRKYCVRSGVHAYACKGGEVVFGSACAEGCNFEKGFWSEGVRSGWGYLNEEDDFRLREGYHYGQICTNGSFLMGEPKFEQIGKGAGLVGVVGAVGVVVVGLLRA